MKLPSQINGAAAGGPRQLTTKRAAITGIAGQDGTYLARGLLRRGHEVHGLLQFSFDREEPVLRRRYPADSQPGGLQGE